MGVDEAGRGCLAGPVVAAAAILPSRCRAKGINDSKSLSPGQRAKAYNLIIEGSLTWGTGIRDNTFIDEHGILPSTIMAMRDAVESADGRFDGSVGIVIVDGLNTIKGVSIPQKAWPKGDRLSINCAAASIIAKVTRDRIMIELDARHPGYGFARHKGYGTREHMEAIMRFGPCPIHRTSFAPFRNTKTDDDEVTVIS